MLPEYQHFVKTQCLLQKERNHEPQVNIKPYLQDSISNYGGCHNLTINLQEN